MKCCINNGIVQPTCCNTIRGAGNLVSTVDIVMEKLDISPLLEYQTDTIERVRKLYSLEKPGRIQEDVRMLRDWVVRQPHFKKKDFSDEYLEVMIISSKGSVERAKKKIDRYCTLRALIPRFFDKFNVREELKEIVEVFRFAVLPKTTDCFYRLLFLKVENSHLLTAATFLSFFKYSMLICEYLMAHDYYQGCIVIVDMSKTDMKDVLANMNITDINNFFTLLIDAYGMRMKAAHFISQSKLIDSFVSILKIVMSQKIGSRIKVHKTTDTMYEMVPKHLLPSDFGGNEKSILDLQEDWLNEMSSERNVTYLKEMCKACTDESLRPQELGFKDNNFGVAGTFRTLNLD